MGNLKILENAIDPLLKQIEEGSVQITIQTSNSTLFQGNVPYYGETAEIRIDSVAVPSGSTFEGYMASLVNIGAEYRNMESTLAYPEETSVVQSENLSQTVSSYSIVSKFNYLSEEYDSAQEYVDETQLPSIISDVRKEQIEDFLSGRTSDIMDYTSNSSKYKNFVLTSDLEFKRGDVSPATPLEEYPYYNQIRINNKITNDFSNFCNRIGIFDAILSAYIVQPSAVEPNSPNSGASISYRQTMELKLQRGNNVDYAAKTVLDLYEWTQQSSFQDPTEYFPLDPDAMSEGLLVQDFKKQLFVGFLKAMSIGNLRKFDQIARRTSCYVEDFVYSVQKFGEQSLSPLQVLWMPAIDNTSIFNDTQIKYGKDYTYVAQSHYIIVGNRYRYTDMRFYTNSSTGDRYAVVTLENLPDILMVPFNMFNVKTSVVQPPPLPPQVNFVTQMNANNFIQLYMSPTEGEKRERFIPIVPSDEDQLDFLRNMDTNNTGLYQFVTYPDSGLYQIFRSKTPPLSYGDFENKKIADIRMSYVSADAIFQDLVGANRKYYYLIRKVNQKGLVSNPSPIYEVELIKDADDSRVAVSIYNFPADEIKEDTKKFQSLLQITPAVEQVIFDDNQSYLVGKSTLVGSIENLNLGMASQSVWGNKFKIRIKSTTTGRIIDYNITFRLTKNISEADF